MIHQAETPNDHKDTEAANLHPKEDLTDEDEGSVEASRAVYSSEADINQVGWVRV